MSRRLPTTVAVLTALALAGCASVAPDEALAPVQARLKAHIGRDLQAWPDAQAPSPDARERIKVLQAAPLTLDGAVELALLNHRGLQVSLAELGVTQAELNQAARWPNPVFAFERSHDGGSVEWDRALHLPLGRLLTRPLVVELERGRLAQQQAQTVGRVVDQLSAVRRAWVDAVAAEESLHYLRQILTAGEAGAELMRRMAEVGNVNRLTLAREQAFEAEAVLGVARGERSRDAARERLARALGWTGDATAIRLPERLPDLPSELRPQPEVERDALAGRLDVQAAREASERTARALGLTRATRFVNVLELGATDVRDTEGQRRQGWALSVELPLFDWGSSRVARAEALYMARLHRTAEVAINARSETREAYGHYRQAWGVARHLQETVVPLRQRISQENLLRYNGMLISVFELLADARAQITSVTAAIEARRDFWQAEANLQAALFGRPANNGSTAAVPPAAAPAATDAGH